MLVESFEERFAPQRVIAALVVEPLLGGRLQSAAPFLLDAHLDQPLIERGPVPREGNVDDLDRRVIGIVVLGRRRAAHQARRDQLVQRSVEAFRRGDIRAATAAQLADPQAAEQHVGTLDGHDELQQDALHRGLCRRIQGQAVESLLGRAADRESSV